jgi:hypothetical protein
MAATIVSAIELAFSALTMGTLCRRRGKLQRGGQVVAATTQRLFLQVYFTINFR